MANPAIIPENVGFAEHEQRDGSVDTRFDNLIFNEQNFNRDHVQSWPLRHGAIGRDRNVANHLKQVAKGKGVNFK